MSIFDLFKKKEPPKQAEPPKMIPVLMEDGSIEEYSIRFYITDGIHCVICEGDKYHTHFDCSELQREIKYCNKQVKGMQVRNARHDGIWHCDECKDLEKLFKE